MNLTPLIPLSLERRGGRDFREGLRPSLTYTPSLLREGGQGDRLPNNLFIAILTKSPPKNYNESNCKSMRVDGEMV